MPFLKEQYEFARAIANENVEDFHGEQAHIFTNPALNECISQVIQNTRKDFLRSEIEKMEGEKWNLNNHSHLPPQAHHEADIRNSTLTSIITRHKEELLELENEK